MVVVVIDRHDIAYCAMASAHGIVDPMCIGVMRLIWGYGVWKA
jgi:hypothetical protein